IAAAAAPAFSMLRRVGSSMVAASSRSQNYPTLISASFAISAVPSERLAVYQQPLRQHTPDGVREAEPIVAGDVAGPEFAANQLAMVRQVARRERLLVLLRVAAQHLR